MAHNRTWLYTSAWIVLCCCLAASLPAQESHRRSIGEQLLTDGTTIIHHAGAIFLSPLHFSNSQWLATAGTIGGVYLLTGVDADVRSFALRNQSGGANGFFLAVKEYGDNIYPAAACAGIYSVGLIGQDDDIRETGLMLLQSLAYAGGLTTVAKQVFGRSRPYLEEGPRAYDPFRDDFDHSSMPSGHSTVAFALSTVLAGRIKNRYATAGLFTLAGLTAYSRVYHDYHWFSDTFAGAAIGTVMGLSVLCLHDPEGLPAFSLYPGPNRISIVFTL